MERCACLCETPSLVFRGAQPGGTFGGMPGAKCCFVVPWVGSLPGILACFSVWDHVIFRCPVCRATSRFRRGGESGGARFHSGLRRGQRSAGARGLSGFCSLAGEAEKKEQRNSQAKKQKKRKKEQTDRNKMRQNERIFYWNRPIFTDNLFEIFEWNKRTILWYLFHVGLNNITYGGTAIATNKPKVDHISRFLPRWLNHCTDQTTQYGI